MELKPGETTERPVRWPDDFPDEAQRGKTKTVRVTLKDVKRKSLPGSTTRSRARSATSIRSTRCTTAVRDGSRGACRARGRRRGAPEAARRASSARTRSTCRRAGCSQLDRRLRAGVPDSRGGARAVRRRVPADGRAAGAARPHDRHDRRAGRARRRRKPTSTTAWRRWRRSAAPIRARCMRRCRRRGVSRRSSAASPRTRSSPGCSRE